jgi:D-xylose transport system ATP-binding protein
MKRNVETSTNGRSLRVTEPGQHPDRILSLRGITKKFGAVRALADVDLDVHAGEVVAIVGDNGAGKSTLVKILAGVYPPDAGSIRFFDSPTEIGSPTASLDLGIATVFQDLALCDGLDVVSNLWLGRELTRGGGLDEVEMEKQSWDLLRELHARITDVRVPVASLSGGQRQTVAIARSLIGDPHVVVLDEPTAALGVSQTAEVLNLIESLRERGLGIILVSHNIADVLAVADRVVVLRLGRNNGDFRASQTTSDSLIAAITGAVEHPRRTSPPTGSTATVTGGRSTAPIDRGVGTGRRRGDDE